MSDRRAAVTLFVIAIVSSTLVGIFAHGVVRDVFDTATLVLFAAYALWMIWRPKEPRA